MKSKTYKSGLDSANHLNIQGIEKLNQDLIQEALQYFNNAIQNHVHHHEAIHNKGICYMKLGETDEAIKCYNEAIKIHAAPEYQLSKALALIQKGEYHDAVATVSLASHHNPDYIEFYTVKCIAYLHQIIEEMENIKNLSSDRLTDTSKELFREMRKRADLFTTFHFNI